MAGQTQDASPRLDAGTSQPQGPGGAVGPLVKTIRWNGSAWECEPLRVRVYIPVGETQRELPIDPKDILLSDERSWLRITAVEQQDKLSVVSVGLRPGVTLRPDSPPVLAQSGASSRIPACRVVTVIPQPKPPARLTEDKCLLTVRVADPTGTSALTAREFGLSGGSASLDTSGDAGGKIILTREIVYRVEPPGVVWETISGKSMRLDGRAWSPVTPAEEPTLDDGLRAEVDALENALHYQSGVFKLQTGLLPPGWTEHATVEACLAESARNLQLSIIHIQGADCGEDKLTVYVKLGSGLLCLLLRNELEDPESTDPNVFPELALITSSPDLGKQVDRQVKLPAQALEMALYLCTLPVNANTWEPAATRVWTPDNVLAVIPEDRTANPPDLCRLALELRLLKDWSDPGVAWSLTLGPDQDLGPPPALDDAVSPQSGLAPFYRAPSAKVWKEGGSPTPRTLTCCVNAPNGKSKLVPGYTDIHTALAFDADINITERARKVRLKVCLGPSDLMSDPAVKLQLADTATKDLLVREFYLDIDFV